MNETKQTTPATCCLVCCEKCFRNFLADYLEYFAVLSLNPHKFNNQSFNWVTFTADFSLFFFVSFFALTWSLTSSWRREKKAEDDFAVLPFPSSFNKDTFFEVLLSFSNLCSAAFFEYLFPSPGLSFSTSFLLFSFSTARSCCLRFLALRSRFLSVSVFSVVPFCSLFFSWTSSGANIMASLTATGATSSTDTTGTLLTTLSSGLGWNPT